MMSSSCQKKTSPPWTALGQWVVPKLVRKISNMPLPLLGQNLIKFMGTGHGLKNPPCLQNQVMCSHWTIRHKHIFTKAFHHRPWSTVCQMPNVFHGHGVVGVSHFIQLHQTFSISTKTMMPSPFSSQGQQSKEAISMKTPLFHQQKWGSNPREWRFTSNKHGHSTNEAWESATSPWK